EFELRNLQVIVGPASGNALPLSQNLKGALGAVLLDQVGEVLQGGLIVRIELESQFVIRLATSSVNGGSGEHAIGSCYLFIEGDHALRVLGSPSEVLAVKPPLG